MLGVSIDFSTVSVTDVLSGVRRNIDPLAAEKDPGRTVALRYEVLRVHLVLPIQLNGPAVRHDLKLAPSLPAIHTTPRMTCSSNQSF